MSSSDDRHYRCPLCGARDREDHEAGCENHPGFDLLPNGGRDVPKLYAQERAGEDAIVHLKWFLPGTGWSWYITEYDPVEEVAFGYVVSGLDPAYNELGYVSAREVMELRVGPGIRAERDLYFPDGTTVGQVKRGERR
jgi:hypothetical protein